MKRFLLSTVLVCAGLMGWAQESAKDDYVSDQIVRQKVVENGGTGWYRTVVVAEKTLQNFTVYRPRSVKAAARHEGPLPILIWCNGACVDSSQDYERMLNKIASNGYVVVAIGKMMINKGEREENGSSEQQVVEAINWLVKQEALKTSDYYKAIDVNNIALSGHSCGGAQAIANCGNARVKTLLIMNAGMGGMSMGGASPQSLKQLHCPLIYMTGGTGDVAYENAKTDFNNITKVPVVWADLSTAGHGGTYWSQEGGDFGRIALAWMNWQQKGHSQNARIFLKPDLKDFSQWTIKNKNFGDVDYEAPYKELTTVGEPAFNREAAEETFAFGADVSLLTQQTKNGKVFNDINGKKSNVLSVLKDEGMNSIRLSMLVNPSDGVCNLSYTYALANKVKQEDMSLMLCLHYTDNLNDIGSQLKPAKWKGHDMETLEKDVRDHTTLMVKNIKKSGVDLRWVQVGYQLDDGMLWPEGRISKGVENFTRLFNSAYDAIKEIDPNIQVVLHVADVQNYAVLKNYFDTLEKAGTKWDVIGLSAYPKVSGLQPTTLIKRVVENVTSLKERYGKPVMIVETGHYNDQQLESNHFLCDFIQQLIEAGAQGCFYWEPEVTDNYNLGAWNPFTRNASIALEAFKGLKHSEVPYMSIAWNTNMEDIFDGSKTILLPVKATHINDRIEKVDLKEGKEIYATSTEAPYTLEWEEASPGIHSIHALATDLDGETASTDTLDVIVGPATVLKNGTIQKGDDGKTSQTWEVNFEQTGTYLMLFKYRTEGTQYVKMYMNDEPEANILFKEAEEGETGYKNRKSTINEVGKVIIKMEVSETYTLPEFESLTIIPLEGQSVPTTNIGEIVAQTDIRLQVNRNKLTVEADAPLRHVRVFSAGGMLLKEAKLNGNHRTSLSLDNRSKGSLLLIQVETERGMKTLYVRM